MLAACVVGLLLLGSTVWLDASFAGPANERFLDSGDGTVIDRSTGLRWQKCSYGQRYRGGLCSGEALRVRWHDAVRLCRALAKPEQGGDAADAGSPGAGSPTGLAADGGDWQLPVQKDLESLLVYRPDGARPFIDLDYFPSSYPLRYWSGSSQIDARGTSGVVVNFLEGTVYAERAGIGESDGKNYVRCVDVGRRAAASISAFIERR